VNLDGRPVWSDLRAMPKTSLAPYSYRADPAVPAFFDDRPPSA
jgi:hypothetical protein